MAEEKKEKWLNLLSATMIVIAVCATLSTFKLGGFNTGAMLAQSKASDQWAFFQAKSIKSYIIEIQKDNLQLELLKQPNKKTEEEINTKIAAIDKKIKKYADEKDQITKDAQQYETLRDSCKKHAENFGLAVIYLQVGILMASLAGLMKKKALWYISIAVGIIGTIYFTNGFSLFF